MKEKKKQRTAEEEQGAPTEGKGKWGSGSVGRGGTEAAAELWSKFCKVRRDLVTPLEMDSPWITSKSLALVDGFGAHTAIKLVGFIKGEYRVGATGSVELGAEVGGRPSSFFCVIRSVFVCFFLRSFFFIPSGLPSFLPSFSRTASAAHFCFCRTTQPAAASHN